MTFTHFCPRLFWVKIKSFIYPFPPKALLIHRLLRYDFPNLQGRRRPVRLGGLMQIKKMKDERTYRIIGCAKVEITESDFL
jgi:hypothetical protein